jgi:hypothetical protein
MDFVDRNLLSRYDAIQLYGSGYGQTLFAISRDGGFGLAQSTIQWSVNTWHHAAGVFIAANSRKVYLDGGNMGSDVTNIGWVPKNRVDIGQIGRNLPADFYNGRIADAAMWNVELTQPEIAILAKGFCPLFVRRNNLVRYYRAWRMAGTNLIDFRQGFHLNAGGVPANAEHCRQIYTAEPFARSVYQAPAPPSGGKWWFNLSARPDKEILLAG